MRPSAGGTAGGRPPHAPPSTGCSTASRTERRSRGPRRACAPRSRSATAIAQDLHDEVNQALTAILLRLEASIHDAPEPSCAASSRETKRLAGQAMEELLQLARELRPTALDDHGLVPALHTQVARLRRADRDPTRASAASGDGAPLCPRAAARALPRHAGEPVERRPARAVPRASRSSCRSSGARSCGSPTTARGFDARGRDGGLGPVRACASARCSSAAILSIRSRARVEAPGVELTMD